MAAVLTAEGSLQSRATAVLGLQSHLTWQGAATLLKMLCGLCVGASPSPMDRQCRQKQGWGYGMVQLQLGIS